MVQLIPILVTLIGSLLSARKRKKLEKLSMKPGVNTSEFWVTIGTMIAPFICKFVGPDCDMVLIAGAVSGGAYVLARAITKYAFHRDQPSA